MSTPLATGGCRFIFGYNCRHHVDRRILMKETKRIKNQNFMKADNIENVIVNMSVDELRDRLKEYMKNDDTLTPHTVAIEVRLSAKDSSSCRYDVLLVDENGQEKEVKFRDRYSRLVYIYTLMHPEGYQRRKLMANNYRVMRQLYSKLYFSDADKLLNLSEKSFDHFFSQAVAQSRAALRSMGVASDELEIGHPRTYGRLLIPFVKKGNTVIIDRSLLK